MDLSKLPREMQEEKRIAALNERRVKRGLEPLELPDTKLKKSRWEREAEKRLDLAANTMLPDRLQKHADDATFPKQLALLPGQVKAADSMLPPRLQSRMGDKAEFTFERRDPGLDEEKMAAKKDDEEKDMEKVADGVMTLVELTRQLLAKEPVLFEEADIR